MNGKVTLMSSQSVYSEATKRITRKRGEDAEKVNEICNSSWLCFVSNRKAGLGYAVVAQQLNSAHSLWNWHVYLLQRLQRQAWHGVWTSRVAEDVYNMIDHLWVFAIIFFSSLLRVLICGMFCFYSSDLLGVINWCDFFEYSETCVIGMFYSRKTIYSHMYDSGNFSEENS